jgi:hypothetical protein
MFTHDPTLYGATIPFRDYSVQAPYLTQWQQMASMNPITPPFGFPHSMLNIPQVPLPYSYGAQAQPWAMNAPEFPIQQAPYFAPWQQLPGVQSIPPPIGLTPQALNVPQVPLPLPYGVPSPHMAVNTPYPFPGGFQTWNWNRPF